MPSSIDSPKRRAAAAAKQAALNASAATQTHRVPTPAAARASAATARDDVKIQADIASMKYRDDEYALLYMLSDMDKYYQEFRSKGYDKKKITDLMRTPIKEFFKKNSLNDQAFSVITASNDSFRTTDTYRELNNIMQTIYYDRPTEAPLYAKTASRVPTAETVASVTQTSRGLASAARASTPVSSVTASVGTKKATTPWWQGIFGFRPKVKSTMAASPDQARIEAITPRAPALATTVKAGERVRFGGVEVEPIPLLDGYRDQARVGRRRIGDIKLEDRNTRESTNPRKRTISPSTTPNDKVSKTAETHKDFAIGEAAEKIYKESIIKESKKCDLSALSKFTDVELKSYLDRVLSQEVGAAQSRLEPLPVTEKIQFGIIAERLRKIKDYAMIAMPWDLAKAQTAEAEEKTRADLFVDDVAPSRSKADKTLTTPKSAFKPGKNKSDYGIAADAARRVGVIQTRSAAPAATAKTTEGASSKRTVIQDYWYTNAHIEDLGTQWQNDAANRLFIPINRPGEFAEERQYKTGLTQQNVNALRAPCKIMLPLNKGGDHWTAITADVTIGANGRKIVKLSFTDSLGAEREYDKLPQGIKAEMDRIGNLFRGATVTKEIYAHTWKQPDGSSCGPYSIANAVRCLDGKNAELNPGREAIRRQQLDVMTNNTAIKSCSTNNTVDEAIRCWVSHRRSENKSYTINNDIEFTEMCRYFASSKNQDINDVITAFISENDNNTLSYVQRRMCELIVGEKLLEGRAQVVTVRRRQSQTPGVLSASVQRPSASVQQAPTTPPLDVITNFEKLRKELKEELGSKGSYRFVGKIMQDLALIGTDEEALERVSIRISKLEDQGLVDRCLKVVAIVQKDYKTARSKEKYATKLYGQSKSYLETYKARKRKDALIEPMKALIREGSVKPEELKELGISENPSERKITTKQAVDFWHARKHKKSFAEVAKFYADALSDNPELRHLPPKQKQRKGNNR